MHDAVRDQNGMNRRKPEKMDTKEYGKMLRRILILEEGRVPAQNARGRKIEGQKKRVTKEDCQNCGTSPTGECWKTEEPYPKKRET